MSNQMTREKINEQERMMITAVLNILQRWRSDVDEMETADEVRAYMDKEIEQGLLITEGMVLRKMREIEQGQQGQLPPQVEACGPAKGLS